MQREAASSIASGRPSTLAQIWATIARLSSVKSKSCLTALALSRNKSTADPERGSPTLDAARREAITCGSGTANGWTAYSCSPRTCSGSRLVASTRMAEHSASSSATEGAEAKTCSKLSRRSKARLSASWSFRQAMIVRPPDSRKPSDCATAPMTRSAFRMGARFTKWTPCSNSSATAEAIAMPRRVFPTPPGPVRVRRRTPSRRSIPAASATSRSRPTKGDGSAGKLLRGSPSSAEELDEACLASKDSDSRSAKSPSTSSLNSSAVRNSRKLLAFSSMMRPMRRSSPGSRSGAGSLI